MRILVVAPGPTHSTYDVYRGLTVGLRDLGHTVGVLALHGHLEHADRCLNLAWKHSGADPERKPNPQEVIFHASEPVVTRALLHHMDTVLFVASGWVHDKVYEMLRSAGVRTAMLLTESPYEDARQAEIAGMVDVVWTNERTSVERLRFANPNTFYLPHAHDPEVHQPTDDYGDALPSHDVVFVGTLWQERAELFAAVDWTGIDFGLYGTAKVLKDPRNRAIRKALRPHLREGYVSNAATAALYRRAKIGLNPHRTSERLAFDAPRIGHAESLNPRCYEQAAVGGALLLTDDRPEAHEVFGAAVPTFAGPKEMAEQIRHFLADETARVERVRALREAVAPHTFAARAAQLTADLADARRPLLAKGA